jgi:hypothetical protein
VKDNRKEYLVLGSLLARQHSNATSPPLPPFTVAATNSFTFSVRNLSLRAVFFLRLPSCFRIHLRTFGAPQVHSARSSAPLSLTEAVRANAVHFSLFSPVPFGVPPFRLSSLFLTCTQISTSREKEKKNNKKGSVFRVRQLSISVWVRCLRLLSGFSRWTRETLS